MWNRDLALYPRRNTVRAIARNRIAGHVLEVAAEVFKECYLDDMKLLKGEFDRPPCTECDCKTIYLCYLTSCECRVFAVWDDMMR
jgi:hypothetical protein